jgi:hypothetical protein
MTSTNIDKISDTVPGTLNVRDFPDIKKDKNNPEKI